jgi:hypothetical protein
MSLRIAALRGNQMEVYRSEESYRRLVEALAAIKPCPVTGEVTDQVKIALGEVGDIWPNSIKDCDED